MRKYDSNDWASFHDAVLDATGVDADTETLKKLYKKLPSSIKHTAMQWGMSDTVFGDEVYRHFHPKEVKDTPYYFIQKNNVAVKPIQARETMLEIVVGKKGIGRTPKK